MQRRDYLDKVHLKIVDSEPIHTAVVGMVETHIQGRKERLNSEHARVLKKYGTVSFGETIEDVGGWGLLGTVLGMVGDAYTGKFPLYTSTGGGAGILLGIGINKQKRIFRRKRLPKVMEREDKRIENLSKALYSFKIVE
jgi:hypothetical protein